MFGIGKVEELVIIFVMLAPAVLDAVMIAHVLKYRQGILAKLCWIVCIIYIPVLGALYYVYWADLYRRHSPRSQD